MSDVKRSGDPRRIKQLAAKAQALQEELDAEERRFTKRAETLAVEIIREEHSRMWRSAVLQARRRLEAAAEAADASEDAGGGPLTESGTDEVHHQGTQWPGASALLDGSEQEGVQGEGERSGALPLAS